jgi:hypothetical protein
MAQAPKARVRPQRRALANQGGAVVRQSGEDQARPLEAALLTTADRADRLSHGFHSYQARMHPCSIRSAAAAAC